MDSSARKPGWYLWDWTHSEVVRGPFTVAATAEAVRCEIAGDRNLWVVHSGDVTRWEAELAAAR